MSRQDVEHRTLDFVSVLGGTEDVRDASSLFVTFAEALGLPLVLCLKVPETGEEIEECLLLSTYPAAWTERYRDRDYLRHDPLVREIFLSYRPFTWSQVRGKREIGPIGTRILDEMAELGAKEGFVVPIYEASGYTGLVSVAGRDVAISEVLGASLGLACVCLHSKLSVLRRRTVAVGVELSRRERVCLSWAAAGKSDWETGQILGIGSKTVNYHVENAKRKLGVSTRVQAIILAMRQGRLVAVG